MKFPALFKLRVSSGHDPLPDQQALVALSLGFALAVSPHIQHLPAWLSVAIVGVFLWRVLLMRRAAAIPGRVMIYSLAAVLSYLVYVQYGTLLGRDAGIAMLVGLSALKFLEIRTFRDCMVVVFLSMMIVLTSFLYAQSMLQGGYLFVVVILLTSVMQYLNHSDRTKPQGMLKHSVVLIIFALPLSLVLFLLFPRIPMGLFGLPGDSHAGMVGMSDVVKPGSINQLNNNDDIAFRVDITGDVPDMKQRYWRGIVLSEYTDNAWQRHKRYLYTSTQPYPASTGLAVVNYDILLEPSNKHWVFPLDLPIDKPDSLRWGSGQVLTSKSPIIERVRFKLSSSPEARYTWLTEAERNRYTELPQDIKTSLADISAGLHDETVGTTDYIDNVLDYFRNQGFTYTLQPPLLSSSEPIRQFLLETRKGYCEHYASAFALLMRVVGIPARLIAGYQGGEWNPQGEYLVVRQSDAHAWTEVWIEGEGWLRVDPTAVVAPERIEFGLDAIRLLADRGEVLGTLSNAQVKAAIVRPGLQMMWIKAEWFIDNINYHWYQWVIGYGKDEQEGLLKRLGLGSMSRSAMLGTAIVIIMLIAAFQGMVMLRKRRGRDEPAVYWYRQFCRRLETIGLRRGPSEGPRDFACRATLAHPGASAEIEQITSLYVNIHYAGNSDKLVVQRLRDAVKAFVPRRYKRDDDG